MSDPTAATPSPADPTAPRFKRRLSNYLIDKKLQLRYVVIVTLLSGMIAGTLGYLIFDQKRQSTESIDHELITMFPEQNFTGFTRDFESEDRVLVYEMFVAGTALVVILSMFLVVMTHKVAGPLFKTSIYFDRMANGRLSVVTPLRQGDMLQDFFANFKAMHDAVRARAVADLEQMASAAHALRETGATDATLLEELDRFDEHVTRRKRLLT